MKVTIVSNFDLEYGRGPVFRLANILPYLAEACTLQIVSLQEPDKLSTSIFKQFNIRYHVVTFLTTGWFVNQPNDVVKSICKFILDFDSDLCVLGWEYWDIATGLSQALESSQCAFAVMFHSVPFVDALPFPGIYQNDINNRIIQETNPMIQAYLTERSGGAEEQIRRWNVISINETISYYLDHYFPDFMYYKAYPGYALDMIEVNKAKQDMKTFDYVYMAKLEKSKGIFDLVSIIQEIRSKKPNCSILVIGDYLYKKEEYEVTKMIADGGMKNNFVFAGWLSRTQKYESLKKGKVFLYPSLTGDTFSFCLLEALACGLPVVCYDAPFSRIIYNDAPVSCVKYKDTKAFALEALHQLEHFSDSIIDSVGFVERNYSNWEKVAEAEVNVYERILHSAR